MPDVLGDGINSCDAIQQALEAVAQQAKDDFCRQHRTDQLIWKNRGDISNLFFKLCDTVKDASTDDDLAGNLKAMAQQLSQRITDVTGGAEIITAKKLEVKIKDWYHGGPRYSDGSAGAITVKGKPSDTEIPETTSSETSSPEKKPVHLPPETATTVAPVECNTSDTAALEASEASEAPGAVAVAEAEASTTSTGAPTRKFSKKSFAGTAAIATSTKRKASDTAASEAAETTEAAAAKTLGGALAKKSSKKSSAGTAITAKRKASDIATTEAAEAEAATTSAGAPSKKSSKKSSAATASTAPSRKRKASEAVTSETAEAKAATTSKGAAAKKSNKKASAGHQGFTEAKAESSTPSSSQKSKSATSAQLDPKAADATVGFFFFSTQTLAQVMKEHPELSSVEQARETFRRWRCLTKKEKDEYEQQGMAQAEKQLQDSETAQSKPTQKEKKRQSSSTKKSSSKGTKPSAKSKTDAMEDNTPKS